MVPVKSFMVPKDKFITVERDMDVRSAGRVMRDRNIGSLFVTNGKDVIGIANTGTGKTAAFGRPLLNKIIGDAEANKENMR